MKNIAPLELDEVIALATLVVSFLLSRYEPFFGPIVIIAFVYVVICLLFRKYEHVQRKLRK